LVFARARAAVAAATEAQDALGEVGLGVRMGLPTGEPRLTDEGYVGIDEWR
jgi:hypothetical protein